MQTLIVNEMMGKSEEESDVAIQEEGIEGLKDW